MKWVACVFFLLLANKALEASARSDQSEEEYYSLETRSLSYPRVTYEHPKNPELEAHFNFLKIAFKGRNYGDWSRWLSFYCAANPIIDEIVGELPVFSIRGHRYKLRLLSSGMMEDMLLLPVDKGGCTLLDYLPGAVLNNVEHHGGISILLNLQKQWREEEHPNVFGLYEDDVYVGHSLVVTDPSGSHVELLRADPTKKPEWHGTILLLMQMVVLQDFYLKLSSHQHFSPIVTAFSYVDDLHLNNIYLNAGFALYDFSTDYFERDGEKAHLISFQDERGLLSSDLPHVPRESECFESLAERLSFLKRSGQIYDYFGSKILPVFKERAGENRKKIVDSKALFFVNLEKWHYFIKFDAFNKKENPLQ